jgi:uncharacterized protein
MLLFGLIFSTILVGAAWIASVTWCRFFGVFSLYWFLVPMLVAASFAPLLFLGFYRQNAVVDALVAASSVAVGFLNFLFFAALACWLLFGLAKLVGGTPNMRLIAEILFGFALLVSVYGVVNASYLRTVRQTVRLPNLPAAWQGREVALVSDIHLGSVRGKAFSRKIVARLNELRPYAAFVAGDVFDGARSDSDEMLEPWKNLRLSGGAYAVSGNHDEFGDRDAALASMRRAGLRVLCGETVTVEGVQILGVGDGDLHQRGIYANLLRGLRLAPGQPSILLSHEPINLDIPEEAGVSLQLSGHTHGGQFWPWNLMVRRIFGRFAYGLARMGNLQVYTSSGAGTWGPPMRVCTGSEIVILRLEAAPER